MSDKPSLLGRVARAPHGPLVIMFVVAMIVGAIYFLSTGFARLFYDDRDRRLVPAEEVATLSRENACMKHQMLNALKADAITREALEYMSSQCEKEQAQKEQLTALNTTN